MYMLCVCIDYSSLTTEWSHSHRYSQVPRPHGGGTATTAVIKSSSCGDREEGTYPWQLPGFLSGGGGGEHLPPLGSLSPPLGTGRFAC